MLNILYLITVIIDLFSGVLERLPPGLLRAVETLVVKAPQLVNNRNTNLCKNFMSIVVKRMGVNFTTRYKGDHSTTGLWQQHFVYGVVPTGFPTFGNPSSQLESVLMKCLQDENVSLW